MLFQHQTRISNIMKLCTVIAAGIHIILHSGINSSYLPKPNQTNRICRIYLRLIVPTIRICGDILRFFVYLLAILKQNYIDNSLYKIVFSRPFVPTIFPRFRHDVKFGAQ